jgi:hypothetical protein
MGSSLSASLMHLLPQTMTNKEVENFIILFTYINYYKKTKKNEGMEV